MLLSIKNDINEISRVCDEVEKFCVSHKISTEKYHDIILILDEIVTNIIMYAYPDDGEHDFTMEMEAIDGNIYICLSDNGIPFDPLDKSDPDVNSCLEEREIGGLGIFIVRQLSDVVEYSRTDNNENQLKIVVSVDNSADKNNDLEK